MNVAKRQRRGDSDYETSTVDADGSSVVAPLPPSLLSLPEELMAEIVAAVEDAGSEALAAFRATCSTLRNAVNEFQRAFDCICSARTSRSRSQMAYLLQLRGLHSLALYIFSDASSVAYYEVLPRLFTNLPQLEVLHIKNYEDNDETARRPETERFGFALTRAMLLSEPRPFRIRDLRLQFSFPTSAVGWNFLGRAINDCCPRLQRLELSDVRKTESVSAAPFFASLVSPLPLSSLCIDGESWMHGAEAAPAFSDFLRRYPLRQFAVVSYAPLAHLLLPIADKKGFSHGTLERLSYASHVSDKLEKSLVPLLVAVISLNAGSLTVIDLHIRCDVSHRPRALPSADAQLLRSALSACAALQKLRLNISAFHPNDVRQLVSVLTGMETLRSVALISATVFRPVLQLSLYSDVDIASLLRLPVLRKLQYDVHQSAVTRDFFIAALANCPASLTKVLMNVEFNSIVLPRLLSALERFPLTSLKIQFDVHDLPVADLVTLARFIQRLPRLRRYSVSCGLVTIKRLRAVFNAFHPPADFSRLELIPEDPGWKERVPEASVSRLIAQQFDLNVDSHHIMESIIVWFRRSA